MKDQGQDFIIITNFQRYTDDNLTPTFNQEYKVEFKDELGQDKETIIPAFSEVTFSLERETDDYLGSLKISKGEESYFMWSLIYTLLQQIFSVQDVPEGEPVDRLYQ